MATWLVTGAAGFIGSNLVHALIERGERVRGIDDLSTGRRENLEGLSGLEFHEGDITRPEALDAVMDGVDYVLHQAARPSVARSIEDPVATHRVNATGTLMVLEAARRAGVRRLVYASSSSAYGDSPTLPKVETMRPAPLSPYAVSKLAGEHYAGAYSKVFDLSTVSLRYFNVFGPRQDPSGHYAAVIPKFVASALRGENPPVYGDGRQTRDFTYVGNVVEANLKAAVSESVDGRVFNVACGERVDLLDLLSAINDLLGTSIEPVLHPNRTGDVRDSLADISAAREAFGYTGSISLRAGLEQAIDWYRENLV